jgi:hypothetical protein
MAGDLKLPERLDLVSAIEGVRRDLEALMDDVEGKRLVFEATEVRMAFQVQMERTVGVEGGLKVWVVEAGAKGEETKASSHTVDITLVPSRVDGTKVMTGSTTRSDG